MAEYIVNLDCSEPIRKGDVNNVLIVHDNIERIVRCKDCKYHFVEDETTSMRYGDDMCGYWASDHGTNSDGFCAWGERRQDV